MSTSVRVRQNTIAASGVSMSRMRPSAAGLWARCTTNARWVISAGRSALAVPPTVMRTGSSRKRLAMPAMRGGIVAENSTVWRSAGSEPRIVSMSSAKPMSSISSASSRTTVRMLGDVERPAPEVVEDAARRADDDVDAALERLQLAEDRLAAVHRDDLDARAARPYLKIASDTCIASSRVGTSTRAAAAGRPRPIVERVQQRQGEGGRLAGAGRRLADEVAARR